MPRGPIYDCLIIGGGPAGLTAGIYLGRFRRRTMVVDAGQSRAAWIPKTHNLIGYSEGISGPALLARMRTQMDEFGAEHRTAEVRALTKEPDGSFTARMEGEVVTARHVLLASGGLDVEPEIAGIRDAVKAGLVRYCPICDAFEAAGRRIALISYGKCRVKEALLLRGYTADLTVLTAGREMHLAEADRLLLQDAGIKIVTDPVARFSREGLAIAAWVAGRGEPLLFEVIYSALGTRFHSGLATALGAQADDDGALLVRDHQRTSVAGLYAAGDVVRGLSQISIAAAQAAIAATDINNHLPPLRYGRE
jgi:thioredoxin reductase (NADPH)